MKIVFCLRVSWGGFKDLRGRMPSGAALDVENRPRWLCYIATISYRFDLLMIVMTLPTISFFFTAP